MTPEELLIPRYKVIADYPDAKWEVGGIIEERHNGVRLMSQTSGVWVDWFKIKKWPHLFKPLEWFEERKPEEMPDYVKLNPANIIASDSFDKVFKVTRKVKYADGIDLVINDEGKTEMSASNFIPATKEEYDNYLSRKQ